MANVSQFITLGLGTPATIPYYINVGLGIGAAVVVSPIVNTIDLDGRYGPNIDADGRYGPIMRLTYEQRLFGSGDYGDGTFGGDV